MKISIHTIDDLAPLPVSTPARPRRAKPRNWQVAVIYGMIHTGIVTVVVTVSSGFNELGLASLAFHGAVLWLALSVGAMMKKL